MHLRQLAIGENIAAILRLRARRAVRLGLAAAAAFALVSSCAGISGNGLGDAPEIDVAKDPTHSWGESKIAVNPKNPDNLVIVTMGTGFTKQCEAHSPDCRIVRAVRGPHEVFPEASGIFTVPDFNVVSAMVSFDRGKSWKRVDIPVVPQGRPDLTVGATPYVTVTADGTFYCSFDALNWDEPKQALPNAAVAVSKSTDGGLTWSDPVITSTPMAEPKLAADLSTGTLYEASIGWLGSEANGLRGNIILRPPQRYLVRSTDGVKWIPTLIFNGLGNSLSAAHGMLATAFEAPEPLPYIPNGVLCGAAKPPCVVFETIENGRVSPHVLPGPGNAVFSPRTQPMVAADPSIARHFTVAVPMNGREFDVYQTRDSGKTWTGPVVLTEDNTKTHYHSDMAYSADGVLGIMWQTAQPPEGQSAIPAPVDGVWDNPDGGPGAGPAHPYNVWAAISRDGGATFSAPYKVSSADSPAPPPGPMENGGDNYSSIAVSGDHVYVSWADWRTPERALLFRDVGLEQFQNPH